MSDTKKDGRAGRKISKSITPAFFRDIGLNATGKPLDIGFAILSMVDRGDLDGIDCGTVIGMAHGFVTRPQENKDGTVSTTTALEGDFEATNRAGVTIRATTLYLGKARAEQMARELALGAGMTISFGFGVDAMPATRPGSVVPYEWQYRDLLAITCESPLEALKRRMVDHPQIKTLPAPGPAVARLASPVAETATDGVFDDVGDHGGDDAGDTPEHVEVAKPGKGKRQ